MMRIKTAAIEIGNWTDLSQRKLVI